MSNCSYPWQISAVAMFMMLLTGVIVVYAPVWLYCVFMMYIGAEYMTLAGGYLFWLNRRKEDYYEETSVLYSIVITDTRLILMCSVIDMYNLLVIQPELCVNFSNSVFISVLIDRLLLSALVIHAIHAILMYERLSGVEFGLYMPLCKAIKKIMTRIRGIKYEDCHTG